MKRTVQQWINCNPKAMAHEMSDNAKQFAFEDAKADIMELVRENELMRETLRKHGIECFSKPDHTLKVYSNTLQNVNVMLS